MSTAASRFVAACLAALFLAPAAAESRLAEHRLEREHELALDGAGHVRVEHLAGPVSVEAHDGDTVRARLIIRAGGRDDTQARERAEAVELAQGRDGGALWLRARPPLDEHRTLIYLAPDDGADYNRRVRFDGENVTIRSEARWGQHGIPAYVELHLQLPRSTGLDLTQHAGPVTVRGLTGPTRVTMRGDPVSVSSLEAPLEIDSGNGGVEIADHQGRARVASGSSPMQLDNARGGPFELRSHSGRIRINDLSGSLTVETGSGGLEATGINAGERLAVDSGSGDVHLEGDLAPARDLTVVTGGGDLRLILAGAPDAELRIGSARGDISVDLPGLSEVRDHRTQFRAVSGAGRGLWRLESRTGRIRIDSDSGPTSVDDLFGDQ